MTPASLIVSSRRRALGIVGIIAIGSVLAACGGSAATPVPATPAPAAATAAGAGPFNATDAAASFTIGSPYALDAADPSLSQKIQGAISPGMAAYSDVSFGSRYISNSGTRVGYFYVLKFPGTVALDPSFAQGFAASAGVTPTTETLGGKSVTVANGSTNVMAVWTTNESVVVVAVSQSSASDAPAIIGALASANP